jgi:hypothetical protein
MEYFVDDDVFEALTGLFSSFCVKPDSASLRAAASPLCFHPLDEEALQIDAQNGFPFAIRGVMADFSFKGIRSSRFCDVFPERACKVFFFRD